MSHPITATEFAAMVAQAVARTGMDEAKARTAIRREMRRRGVVVLGEVKKKANPKTKRERALTTIFYEVARYGATTDAAMRAYVENRVSHAAFLEACAKGMAHRAACQNAACSCKASE